MYGFEIWKDLKRKADELTSDGKVPSEAEFELVLRQVCRKFDPPDPVLNFYLNELRAMSMQRLREAADRSSEPGGS